MFFWECARPLTTDATQSFCAQKRYFTLNVKYQRYQHSIETVLKIKNINHRNLKKKNKSTFTGCA